MAKSLFNQFAQIRGSRTYDDTLNMAFAEITGRVKEAGLTVDISGTSITRQSGVFEKRDVGNFLIINGSAYGITAANGTDTCTVSSAPGDGTGVSAALMYYQNLEDDLNYIRTMLKEITGKADWFTPPDVALSELTFNFIELVDVFIGGGTYTANNMLYTVSSGVKDTNKVTFDPVSEMLTAANFTSSGTLDVVGAAKLYSSVSVNGDAQFNNNVMVSGTFQFDATGQAVDEIVSSINAASLNSQLPTAKAVYDYVDQVAAGIDTFLELGDTFSFYTANNMLYTTATGISDTNKITYNEITDSFIVSAALMSVSSAVQFSSTVGIGGSTTITDTLTVTGFTLLGDSLFVGQNLSVGGNAVLSGSLQFDSTGQQVDNIVTVIGALGLNTNLATEKAIVDYITLVSGALVAQIESQDTFLELTDTPNTYNIGALVYSQANQIAYTSEINYNNSKLNIYVPTYVSQGIVTEGALNVGQTLTVTGTSLFIDDVVVQEDLSVGINLSVGGNSAVIGNSQVNGNSVVGGNITVSGSFQFDETGQPVDNVTTIIPISGPGSNSNLVTEAAIFNFVNTVSGVLSEQTAAQTYLALTDTESTGYTEGNMIYMTSSGLMDTYQVTFKDNTFTASGVGVLFSVADNGFTALGIDDYPFLTYEFDSDHATYLSGNFTHVNAEQLLSLTADNNNEMFVLGNGKAVFLMPSTGMGSVVGLTLSGVAGPGGYSDVMFALQKGVFVNEIVNVANDMLTVEPERKLLTVKVLLDYITAASGTLDEFIDLNDTPSSYSGAAGQLLRVNNAANGVIFEPNISYNGTTLTIDGNIDASGALGVYGAAVIGGNLVVSGTTNLQGAANIDSSLNVDGITTLRSTLEVVGAAQFDSNVLVSGTFQFDATGQAVNEITTVIDPMGGDNTTLVTENAVWNLVNTVSGVLASGTASQTFVALTDTPAVYTNAAAKFVRVNDSATGLIFEDSVLMNGGVLEIPSFQAFGSSNVSGSLVVQNNLTVYENFGFDTGEVVNEIINSITAPGNNTTLVTSAAVYNLVNTLSGALQTDIIWEISDTPYEQIRPKAEHINKPVYLGSHLTIAGDLTVSGTTTTINTNELVVEDKIITVNAGEVGAGITGSPLAGIEVDRGSEANYLFVFNEQADNFRVGVSGSLTPGNTFELQAVCTREDNPIDLRVPWWDATHYIYRNTGDTYISVNSGTHTLSVVADSDTKMQVAVDNVKIYGDSNDYIEINSDLNPLFKIVLDGNVEFEVTASGMALDSGARVDNITVAISGSGDNMTLVTEKAIVDYVTQISGVLASGTASQTFLALTDTPDSYLEGQALIFAANGVDGTPFIFVSPVEANPTVSGVQIGSFDYGDGETAFLFIGKNDTGVILNTTFISKTYGDLFSIATVEMPHQLSGELSGVFEGDTHAKIATGPNSNLFLESDSFMNLITGSGIRLVSGKDTGNFQTQLVASSSGIRLASGENVNNIVPVITSPGSNLSLVTEKAIVDYVTLTSGTLQYNIDHVKFLDLDDVFVGSFVANNMLYLTSSGVQQTSQMTFNPTTNTISINPADLNVGLFSQTIQRIGSEEGLMFIKIDQNSDVITIGDAALQLMQLNDYGVALTSGVAVNSIFNSMTPTGSSRALLTEEAIYNWVNTVSGTLSSGIAAQTFLALTDTPASYTSTENRLLRVNSSADGLVFEPSLAYYSDTLWIENNCFVSNNLTTYYLGATNVVASGNVTTNSFTLANYTSSGIVNAVSEPGSSVYLVSEKGIVDYVTAVSGVLQPQIDLLEAIHQDTEEPTGFVNRLDSTLSIDGTNVVVSGTAWDYYIKGVKYTINGAKSVGIDQVFEGLQYFYMDTDQNLKRVNAWDNDLLTDYAYVASIYWDDTNNQVIYMGDERHGVVMDAATHKYLHNTQGTVYISGLGLTVVSGVNGDGSVDGHAQITTTQGVIADEDIYHNIAGLGGIAQIPVFYKVGNFGLWRRDAATNFPVKPYVGGNGRLAYNQYVGGSWQQTEVPKGDFVLTHIFATNDPNMQWIAVQGQHVYDTNTEARLGATQEMNSLILTGLPFVEFLPVATIIFQTDEAYTNTIKARIISTDEGADYVDWTKSKLSPVPGSVNDHGNLSGLTDLDHPASAIYTDTTNFNGALSSADTTVQKALDTLDNAIAGIGHAHFDVDCVEVSTNVWEYAGDSTFTSVPSDLQVFVNGLKNRKTSDYYTASVVSGRIRITFAYNVYSEDWVNITYTKASVS